MFLNEFYSGLLKIVVITLALLIVIIQLGLEDLPIYSLKTTQRYKVTHLIKQPTDHLRERQYDKNELIYRNFIGHTQMMRPSKSMELFDFIVIGVKKCGTAALTNFLSMHPQLKFHHLYASEGHYFDIGCLGKSNYQCLSSQNRRQFNYSPGDKSPIIKYGETTPAYFTLTGMAEKLKAYNPNVKAIVITCDPSKRALSDYRHEMHVIRKSQSTRPEKANLMSLFYKRYFIQFDQIVDDAMRTMHGMSDEDKFKQIAEYDTIWEAFWLDFDEAKSMTEVESDLTAAARSLSFNPMLRIVLDGMYNIYMDDYLKHFELGQDLIILDNRDLTQSPDQALQSVETFLGLESFVTTEMFVKPDDSPFYCVNTTEANFKSMQLKIKLGMRKGIGKGVPVSKKRDAPFFCKSGTG